MEKYRIRIFPIAQQDMLEFVDYINMLSPKAASEQYDALIKNIGTLETLSERCPLCKDTQLRLRGYRTLQVNNYIVFYVVNADTVEIRGILYAKRQYESLL